MKSFKELGLNENIINGLNKQGIETPTEIQSLSISDILDGMDVIGEAHTGRDVYKRQLLLLSH